MVTATDRPDILRIVFQAPKESNNLHVEADIVCFLHLTSTGMDILYSHHAFRTRENPVGVFSDTGQTARFELNSALRAIIEHGVILDFFSSFVRSVRSAHTAEERATR